MSNHEDRAPLLLKVALRQALRRLLDEADAFSQFEALAANLGWDDVSEAAAGAKMAIAQAAERAGDAVEATVMLQAEASLSHAHSHEHGHTHSHPHEHPHDHDHSGG
jgi:hypothetical protein